MGYLIYNGVSSNTLGLVIQAPPVYEFPERDATETHVPGVNGDIIIDNGTYKNVEGTYSLACSLKNTTFVNKSSEIVNWLTSAKGYAKLEDSYETGIFRLAVFYDKGSLTNYYDQATAISVTFKCKPFRYLTIGDTYTSSSSSTGSFVNSYNCDSYPLFKFKMTGATGVISFTNSEGTNSVSIANLPSSQYNKDLYLDFETLDFYTLNNGQVVSLNAYISLPNNQPRLLKNETTTYSITGNIKLDADDKYSYKPRWCKL